jgi:hypothetical protein
MIYLAHIKSDNAAHREREYAASQATAQAKLWNQVTHRYRDLDSQTGKLWARGENLDVYYAFYSERNPDRTSAMMKHFHNPAKLNGPLFLSMTFDAPNWGEYGRGSTWTREYGYVALRLQRCSYGSEAFTWLTRGINTNFGLVLPQTNDPRVCRASTYHR